MLLGSDALEPLLGRSRPTQVTRVVRNTPLDAGNCRGAARGSARAVGAGSLARGQGRPVHWWPNAPLRARAGRAPQHQSRIAMAGLPGTVLVRKVLILDLPPQLLAFCEAGSHDSAR